MTEITTAIIPADVTGPLAPTVAEAVTPSASLKDKFGGDVGKLATSYDALETEAGKLRAQIAELQKGKKPEAAAEGDALLQVKSDDNKVEEKKEPSTPEEMETAAIETAKAAGLDYDVLSEEYAKDGKLTDASYKALAKQGIPKSMVDEFIENRVAVANSKEEAAKSAAGFTPATFAAAKAWAQAGGLTAAEGKAFNDAVMSGDPARTALALSFLATKHTAKVGQEPTLINGEGSGGGVGSYADKAQWQADINNPLYKTSPAHRDMVRNKLANSPALMGKK